MFQLKKVWANNDPKSIRDRWIEYLFGSPKKTMSFFLVIALIGVSFKDGPTIGGVVGLFLAGVIRYARSI